MNQREATDAIILRFRDRWPTDSGGVPYTVDNVVADVGAQDALPRAVLNIISFDSTRHTIGPRHKIKREGMIDVRLYDQVGVGRGGNDTLVEVVRGIFEERRIGTDGGITPPPGRTRRVICREASANELRRDREAGGLWLVSVTIDFEFYQVTRT
jgi:hypothetical protein